jgi:hypothetical protein
MTIRQPTYPRFKLNFSIHERKHFAPAEFPYLTSFVQI